MSKYKHGGDSLARRLNFIRNSDRILVLNTGGTISAFDTPENLLKDRNGYFALQMEEENSRARQEEQASDGMQ